MSRSSRSAGTTASRFRPLIPSAMLKTTSTGVAARTVGSSVVASRSITSWPAAAMASRTAWMVCGGSYSASSSLRPSISRLMRFTLKVKPTRTGRLVVHRFQVVVVDAVAPLGKLRLVDDVLDRGEDALPLRRRLLQEGDGEVLAGNELLDEDSGGEPGERLLHQRAEPSPLLAHRVLGDALGAAFEVGLHDERKAPAVELEIHDVVDELPARRDDAVLGEHQLGERLVEGDGEHPGVGAGIGKSELVEECGIESLAKPAPPALGGVEDQLRGGGRDARRRRRGRTHALAS